jgi:hypothetical protein
MKETPHDAKWIYDWLMKRGLLVIASLVFAVSFLVGTYPIHASATSAPSSGAACATLKLTAKPAVNAQSALNDTIRNTVKSCASNTETVTLQQQVIGPFVVIHSPGTVWTITLTSGKGVTKTQRIPWTCCGSYTVTDTVISSSQQVLATKQTGFTFA